MTRLAEIEARLKAATTGGWICTHPDFRHSYGEYVNGCPRCEQIGLQCGVRHARSIFNEACEGDSGDVAWLLELVKTLAAGVRAADEVLVSLSINGPILSANSQELVIKAARVKLATALHAAEEVG